MALFSVVNCAWLLVIVLIVLLLVSCICAHLFTCLF